MWVGVVTSLSGYGREIPNGYAKAAALRRVLDRGLAAWRAAPRQEPVYLTREVLKAAQRYLAAGYRLEPAHLALILRSALHHRTGTIEALGLQRDAELTAEIVGEYLLQLGPLDVLWQLQRADVGSTLWQLLLLERLRGLLDGLNLGKRAHIAAAIYQLETGLPVMEPLSGPGVLSFGEGGQAGRDSGESAATRKWGLRWGAALPPALLGIGLLVLVVLWFSRDWAIPGQVDRQPERVHVAGGFYALPDSIATTDANPELPFNDTESQVYVEAFAMHQTEVTNRAYRACVEAGACRTPLSPHSATRVNYFLNPAYDWFPVVNVTWHDAVAYCSWRGMRLPTSREWTVAAGYSPFTGRFFLYPWGQQFLRHAANSARWEQGDTVAVGRFHPHGNSPFGLRDMGGNVAEWTSTSSLAGAGLMVVKGGSFLDEPEGLQIESEQAIHMDTSAVWLGFRCVE